MLVNGFALSVSRYIRVVNSIDDPFQIQILSQEISLCRSSSPITVQIQTRGVGGGGKESSGGGGSKGSHARLISRPERMLTVQNVARGKAERARGSASKRKSVAATFRSKTAVPRSQAEETVENESDSPIIRSFRSNNGRNRSDPGTVVVLRSRTRVARSIAAKKKPVELLPFREHGTSSNLARAAL